ncbi:hypothetical protein BH11GEM1_BH11GEM1_14340 [soil metagenome]
MTRRSPVWRAMAVLFIVGNVAGAVMAAALLGAYVARRIWTDGQPVIAVVPDTSTDRLTPLEQSLDAVAIEVECVGEGATTHDAAVHGTLSARCLTAN